MRFCTINKNLLIILFLLCSEKYYRCLGVPGSGTTGRQGSSFTKITLDITKKEGTREFEYSRNPGTNVDIYSAMPGHQFAKVVTSGHDLFEVDSDKCRQVEVDESSSGKFKFKFTFPNESCSFIVNDPSTSVSSQPSTTTQPTTSNLVTVDLNTKQETNEFEYSRDDTTNVETYTPKTGYKFGKVVKSTHHLFELDDSQKCDKLEVDYSTTGKLKLKFTFGSSSFSFSVNDPTTLAPSQPLTTTEVGPKDTGSEPVSEPSTSTSSEQQPSVSPTLDVDLNTRESTTGFEYSRNPTTNVDTYTAKPGHKFKKILKGGDSVWESSDNRYLLKFDADFSQLGNIVLSLYYDASGSHELHVATDPHPDPLSETSDTTRVTLDSKSALLSEHLKVLTLGDDGTSRDVEKSKFSVEGLTDLYCYTFKEGSRCTEIKHNNVSVWKHDPQKHGDNYPTTALLNASSNLLYVESLGHYQYSFSYYNEKWNQVSGFKPPEAPQKLDVNKLELETLNMDGTTTNNDSTQFERKDMSDGYVFVFERDAKCTIVRYDGHTLWKYDENEFGDDFPTKVAINTQKNYVMVDSGNKYRYMYTYYHQWRQELGYKSSLSDQLHFNKLTVVTLDDQGNTKENDETKYETEKSNVTLEYKFKDGAKCTEVIYDGKSVWKYDENEHGDDHPTSLTLNRTRSTLVVDSADNYRYVLGYYNNEWRALPYGYTSKKVAPKPVEEFKATPDKLTVVTLDDQQQPKENDDTKYEKEDGTVLFVVTLKLGVKCTELKYDDVLVWNYDQKEHGNYFPTSLALNKTNNLLMVNSPEYQFYYSYYNNKWNAVLPHKSQKLRQELASQTTSPGSSGITLDPRSTLMSQNLQLLTLGDDGTSSELDESKFSVEGLTDLYCYRFKHGSRCTEIKHNNVPVWTHNIQKHGHDYPTTALINKNNNFLYVESAGSYQYSLSYYNEQWNQVSGYTPPKLEKLYVNKLELETLKRDGTTVKNDSSAYDTQYLLGLHVFKFKRGVKCTKVIYDSHPLWTYDENEFGDDFPTTITLHPQKNYVMVDSGNKYRYLYTYYHQWRQELGYKSSLSDQLHFNKLTVVTLDDQQKRKENDTTKYERKDKTTQLEYKFKDGAKCTEVIYDRRTVWKHDSIEHGDDHPTSLTLNRTRSTLVVDSADNYRYVLGYYNNQWRSLPLGYTSKKVAPRPSFAAEPNKLKVVTLDDDGTTKENDTSKYQPSDVYVLFQIKFNDGVKCTEVKYDGESLWTYDQNQHGDCYPSTVTLNKESKLVLVDSSEYQFYYIYQDDQWNLVSYEIDIIKVKERLKSLDIAYHGKSQLDDLIELRHKPLGDFKYSKVKETSQKQDESDVYILEDDHELIPKSKYKVPYYINSAFDLLAESAKFFKEKPHLGMRKKTVNADGTVELGEFEFISYEESFKQAKAIGTALTKENLVPETTITNCKLIEKARFLGIWARNCPLWLLTDYACTGYRFVSVPLYEKMSEEALLSILNSTKMETLCIDSNKVSELEKLNPKYKIKTVILFDSLTDNQKAKLDQLDIKYHFMDELINKHKDNPLKPPQTKRTDICTIMCNSGTVGASRGTVHTNESLFIFAERYGNAQNRATMRYESTMLSFLPIAHVYERTVEHIFCILGGKIGYYSGDLTTIVDDFQTFKPTFFVAVPRAYTKILGKIREQVQESWGKAAVIGALKEKKDKFKTQPHDHKTWMYDAVLSNISKKLGGKLEGMISGSAAMTSEDVCDLQAFFLAPMAEGWGATEVGVPLLQDYRDPEKGTIGGPLHGVQFKLRSVPEFDYNAKGTPPRGELLVKGPGMMLGYFARDDLTQEALKDGWFMTGDVVELLPNMGLKMIDRLKNIKKLSQGFIVTPERLENYYVSSKYVEQVYIHVDSTKDHIVGLVVLSKLDVEKWVQKNKVQVTQATDLLNNQKLKKAIQDDFENIAKAQNFHELEKLKVFTLLAEPFNVDDHTLTPTFKLVRRNICDKYKDKLEKMYSSSQST